MKETTKRMTRATIYTDAELLREFRIACSTHGISVSKAVSRLMELIANGEFYNELDRVTKDHLSRTE